jgi:predicted XRE-type DNA-binding protein
LKPGTLFEGIKSRAERGAMGSFMGFKLTLAKVRRIRYLYHTAKIKQSTLAKVYHVSQPAISFIVRGVTWKEA